MSRPEPKPEPKCEHEYKEVSGPMDMDGETYKCSKCGHRYRLYYDEMR